MTNQDIREAHRIITNAGSVMTRDQTDLLLSLLPPLPKQKTLEEIAWDMHFAWTETVGNDWKEELFGDLEPWLSEQHNQLRDHLEGVKGEDHPEFLTTEADFVSAPEGTIVAWDGSLPWYKLDSEWLPAGAPDGARSRDMSNLTRRVLRWGMGYV